ncbi:MAG TPA: hypothetical protein ENF83_03195 [Candidatus Korarchaeota archaeon]|nr:hypothetical protein [Candidatus Korarchaeota archaeon]
MVGLSLVWKVVAWEFLVAAAAYLLMAITTGLSPKKSPQVGFFALGFALLSLAMAARFVSLILPPDIRWKLAIPSGALIFMSASALLSGFTRPSSRPIAEAGVIVAGTAVLALVGNDPSGLPLVELCYGVVFLILFTLAARVYSKSGLSTHLSLALGLLLIGLSGLLPAVPLSLLPNVRLILTASLHLGAAVSFVWALAGV